MTDVEVAWLAGLLEGEGSFMRLSRPSRPDERPRISCMMTDLDVIQRLDAITGIGGARLHPASPNQLGVKPIYSWIVHRRAEVRDLCVVLRPHMGERRRAQIDKILDLIGDVKTIPAGHCMQGHHVIGDNAMPAGSQTPRCRTCHNERRRKAAVEGAA